MTDRRFDQDVTGLIPASAEAVTSRRTGISPLPCPMALT
jgi:hypothetical protein